MTTTHDSTIPAPPPSYSYADALRRLAALGFGPDTQRPAPPTDEPVNDWLYARCIPELSDWFQAALPSPACPIARLLGENMLARGQLHDVASTEDG